MNANISITLICPDLLLAAVKTHPTSFLRCGWRPLACFRQVKLTQIFSSDLFDHVEDVLF